MRNEMEGTGTIAEMLAGAFCVGNAMPIEERSVQVRSGNGSFGEMAITEPVLSREDRREEVTGRGDTSTARRSG